MNISQIIEEFHPESKVWIYTSENILSEEQTLAIQKELDLFCSQWTAHSKELKAGAHVYQNRFIIISVDEHLNSASGCSIDKSVHLMQDFETKYHIHLFNRLLFSYKENRQCITLSRDEFEKAVSEGLITENTIVYNTLVKSVAELSSQWEIPFRDSWMFSFFPSPHKMAR